MGLLKNPLGTWGFISYSSWCLDSKVNNKAVLPSKAVRWNFSASLNSCCGLRRLLVEVQPLLAVWQRCPWTRHSNTPSRPQWADRVLCYDSPHSRKRVVLSNHNLNANRCPWCPILPALLIYERVCVFVCPLCFLRVCVDGELVCCFPVRGSHSSSRMTNNQARPSGTGSPACPKPSPSTRSARRTWRAWTRR